MINYNDYKMIKKANETLNGELAYDFFIHGIAYKYWFDEYGSPVTPSGPSGSHTYNLSTTIEEDFPTSGVASEQLVLKWNPIDTIYFDYIGLMIVNNEVLFINTHQMSSKPFFNTNTKNVIIPVSAEGKTIIKRACFSTKKELHVKESFIRTAVNMTNSILDLSYSDNAELSESKPFSPVVSSGTVNIDINAIEWGHSIIDGKVNEYKLFEMSNRYAVYLFSGVREEKICDFVGFISSFNIIPTQDKIEVRFEDKTSLYWNEEIPTSDRFDGELVIDAIAKIMQYPRHKMKYSDSMLNDSHFFTVSNLTTKQYTYYKDLFSDLSKELMFRMSFDACENIVLQSEVV
ncbi:MAG: hypothetical protein ACRC6B_10480, partial [Fusobacteriaceae bacterium]